MGTQLYYLINLVIILVVFVFLVKYVWDIFFSDSYNPVAWNVAVKAGRIDRELLRMEKKYPDKVRFFNFWFQVERLKKDGVAGAFAEAGVYRGDSARVIHRMDPGRRFHLFDTFSGFTEKDLVHETGEAATYTVKNFADTSVSEAARRIGGNENIFFHPGYIPGVLEEAAAETFALVNLDLDLYLPTKAALEFFYSRLVPGGVMIVHDYNPKWEGICRAVDEFVRSLPETLILLPDIDGTCMIIRSR